MARASVSGVSRLFFAGARLAADYGADAVGMAASSVTKLCAVAAASATTCPTFDTCKPCYCLACYCHAKPTTAMLLPYYRHVTAMLMSCPAMDFALAHARACSPATSWTATSDEQHKQYRTAPSAQKPLPYNGTVFCSAFCSHISPGSELARKGKEERERLRGCGCYFFSAPYCDNP